MRSLADLQAFWRGHSVESAFLAPAPPAAASPTGAGTAGVHWVRPGALCCAVLTSQAQLQVGRLQRAGASKAPLSKLQRQEVHGALCCAEGTALLHVALLPLVRAELSWWFQLSACAHRWLIRSLNCYP